MIKFILTLSTILLSHSAFAKIGPAGCGLGNSVIGGDGNQVLAITVNHTGTQTFGLTSGTSNCVDGKGMARLDSFIETNRVALSKEMARGEGETLAGVAHILGCTNQAEIFNTLKGSYDRVFTSENTDSTAVSSNIQKVLRNSPVASRSCLRLI